jgi:uncharacterized membrane protein YhaH (DUF805 family)
MGNNNIYNYKTPKSGNEETGFFNIKGRINRKSFILRCLFSFGLFFIFTWFYYNDFFVEYEGRSFIFFETIYFYILPVFISIFNLIQGAKRMHDVNKSGWNFFIPLYNIYLTFSPGTRGNNDYGIDPSPAKNIQYFDEIESNKQDVKEEVTDSVKKGGLDKWRDHLNNVRKENPNKTYQEILAIARNTYSSSNINNKNKLANANQITSKRPKLLRYKYLFILLGLLMSLVFYGMYLDQIYPKNELELKNLMCDKYWRITDASVEEIYLNNVLVQQPTSDIRHQLARMANGDETSKLYEKLTKLLLSQKNNNGYIYFSKDSNACYGEFNYLYYDQYFNSDSSKLTYTERCMKLDKTINGYYIVKSEDSLYSYVPPLSHFNCFVKSHSIQIDYIDSEKLDVIILQNIIDDDKQELKVEYKVSYEQLHLPINRPRLIK